LQKELNLSFEEAEQVKHGKVIEGVSQENIAALMQSVSEVLLLEIQKTFDFFRATSVNEQIQRIYVSGGCSQVTGLLDHLKNNQSGPVRVLDVLSDCVQKTEGLWLKDLTQKDNLITLNGMVMGTPSVIADFITNLEQIGKFKNINLINVQETESKYSFSITFQGQLLPKTEPNT
jgi:cell division ATPase FtsA